MTPSYSINFRSQIENKVSDFRLLSMIVANWLEYDRIVKTKRKQEQYIDAPEKIKIPRFVLIWSLQKKYSINQIYPSRNNLWVFFNYVWSYLAELTWLYCIYKLNLAEGGKWFVIMLSEWTLQCTTVRVLILLRTNQVILKQPNP